MAIDFKRLQPNRVKQGIKKRIREHQRSRPLVLEIAVGKGFDYNEQADLQQTVLTILSLLKPHEIQGFVKRRVGSPEDGGYVMIDDFAGLTSAYSFGINDDVSWDSDFASMIKKPIHMFDHTINRLPIENSLFEWRKIGIAEEDDLQTSMRSVMSILAENGHSQSRDLVLKCDIEGCEWKVLASKRAKQFLECFRQIVIEVHDMQRLTEPEFLKVAQEAVTNLTRNHFVVHVHANNFGPYCIVSGIPIPSVLEFTLLRKDRGIFQTGSTIYPTAFDAPNDRKKADFALGAFVFR